MGTLLTLEPTAPLLREALLARAGVDVGDEAARAATRDEFTFYRAHLHLGRDAAAVDELRRECGEAMRPALGLDVPNEVLTAALLDALRFRAFDDAAPALARLREAGWRLVVVSNWDASLQDRLAETGLAGLVDGAVASAEIGSAKPDGAIFARGLELAGVGADAAWHVGDSVEADVEGARAAGIRPVLVDRGDAGVDLVTGADDRDAAVPTIASLAALPALLGA